MADRYTATRTACDTARAALYAAQGSGDQAAIIAAQNDYDQARAARAVARRAARS